MFDVRLRPVAAALLGFLFVAIALGLMASSRGVPAVFDGNETFSSILHAKNLLAFGPGVSAGLADESTSPRPSGHPVVHTHQGNFPRLYTAFLSTLGLGDPVSQVAATVLPIGFVGVLLLFFALHRYAGFALSVTALAILLTDYILFAQWQVVTYRVWHFAFTAALLAITISYRESPRRWLLLALFVTSAFLFYYELVFATFLAVSVSVLALLLWRCDIGKGLIFVGTELAGAVAGAGVVIAQLVSYLGWDGFVTDLRLTYLSRNAGITDSGRLAELRAFVEQHNIAFLYNFIDGSGLRSPGFVLDSIFRWGLQVYTPPFTYCILILAFGIAVALFAPSGATRFPKLIIAGLAALTAAAWLFGSSGIVFLLVALGTGLALFAAPRPGKAPQRIAMADAAIMLGPLAFVFVLLAATFSRFVGYERAFGAFWPYGLAFIVALAVLAVLLMARAMPEREGNLSLDAVLRAASILCVGVALSQFHHRLYDQALTPLWERSLPGPWMPASLQSAGMSLATACAAAIAAIGPSLPRDVSAPLRDTARRVALLIASFLIGLLAVIVLFPGYVYSGYMARYLNVLVLPFALAIGFALYAVIVVGKHVVANADRAAGFPSWPAAIRTLCLATPIVLVGWWIAIQTANARLFPANGLAVLNALDALAPDRPTIVANSYPAPFAVTTGQWSYLDETFASGRIAFSPSTGYAHSFDRKYLWFADRERNSDYAKPDAFVCLLTPTYRSVSLELADPQKASRCVDNGMVQWTRRHEAKTWPQHIIAARDPSGRDSWAIVKLDWDVPPYLTAPPRIAAERSANSITLTVSYDFRQQDGKPEYQTDVEIWLVARNGSFCAVQGTPLAAERARGGRTTLVLAPSDADNDLIALARPQTETRIGGPFFTAPFRLEGGEAVPAGASCDILRDTGGRHRARLEGG
jgi:hypothetical protein